MFTTKKGFHRPDGGALPDLSGLIQSGDTIVWGQADAQPRRLTRALVEQRHAWNRLRIFLGIGHGDLLQPAHADRFDFLGYGASGANRRLAKAGVLDILPCHYSEIPGMIRRGALRVDVVMVRVSPPDDQGRYSLGLANDYLCAAVEAARVVIGEVDPAVPWTYGERSLGRGDFHLLVSGEEGAAPSSPAASAPSLVEQAIARHVAGLVEDGATLQVGIGKLPDALLEALSGHRELGFHSGAAGDGLVDLVERGVVTNARKPVDAGVSVAGVLIGSSRLHTFAHRNPALRLRTADYTHDLRLLASLPRFVALNSALEVDLAGQVNSEVADGTYVGAVGGSADFVRGAHASRGGLPIVALASTTGGGSRIVARLGGPATLSAADAGIVVTEYGVADLRGQSLSERRRRLLAIAHPEHREALELEGYVKPA